MLHDPHSTVAKFKLRESVILGIDMYCLCNELI